MNTPPLEHFLCDTEQIEHCIGLIDPRSYDKTRNYLDGSVTWLSPFITHGVTDTKRIADRVLQDHRAKSCYRLLFELGWREFFHRTWQLSGDDIFHDMRHSQSDVHSERLPEALVGATTGIDVVDKCLERLKDDGVMHNHARMWVAGMSCNMAGTYWLEPARWLHYHLLDGDLASNTLSWQWIAGTFSNKRYVANQDNINKYSRHEQSDTWLDVPYEALERFDPPEHLRKRCDAHYDNALPGQPIASTGKVIAGDLALRSIWNLDPSWCEHIRHHIVFVDTTLAKQWPMSPKRWQFIKHWAGRCNADIVYGTLEELQHACANATPVRMEYPACNDWPGEVMERQWLFPMPDNAFDSFSQYFKQVKHHAGL